MMENKYVRSIGLVPYEWLGYGADVNSFQHGGGLGLRGYAGYLAPEEIDGEVVMQDGQPTGATPGKLIRGTREAPQRQTA